MAPLPPHIEIRRPCFHVVVSIDVPIVPDDIEHYHNSKHLFVKVMNMNLCYKSFMVQSRNTLNELRKC
jgi:hypothetical protein